MALAAAGSVALTGAVRADATVSVYGGYNASPDSTVDYNFNQGAGPQSASVGWDGASFEMSPYYGARVAWWFDSKPSFGLAIDYTHAKVVASPMPAGFSVLEFTDGINIVTANLLYRYQTESRFTPYGGVGAGVSIPYVEVVNTANTSRTAEFQMGGLALQAMIGVDAQIYDNWSVFGEFKSSYTENDVDLNGGGSLSTNIVSNQVIFGVSYKFD